MNKQAGHEGALVAYNYDALVENKAKVTLKIVDEAEMKEIDPDYPWHVFAILVEKATNDVYLILTEVQMLMIAKTFKKGKVEDMNFDEGVSGKIGKQKVWQYELKYA